MTDSSRRLEGGCHCGAHRFCLIWPTPGAIPARRCTCTYCLAFGGTWTSHADARLVLQRPGGEAPVAYRFGTATADFLHCGRCGVVFAAVDRQGPAPLAVVNVRTLDAVDTLTWSASDSCFDAESVTDRQQRRQARWSRVED